MYMYSDMYLCTVHIIHTCVYIYTFADMYTCNNDYVQIHHSKPFKNKLHCTRFKDGRLCSGQETVVPLECLKIVLKRAATYLKSLTFRPYLKSRP